ncbi:MAG: hypothetical protein L0H79_12860 [Intrasporangium sp.]|uniref:hypothetical protein n=1 Tax=Intrasporangium sp. TaxID=1925024 RepID=UPI0026478E5A|nr:hypothetical protein [Intrasporangium sp.]MDN5796631.1 hypothetical protein [Intrasporangium sp.]
MSGAMVIRSHPHRLDEDERAIVTLANVPGNSPDHERYAAMPQAGLSGIRNRAETPGAVSNWPLLVDLASPTSSPSNGPFGVERAGTSPGSAPNCPFAELMLPADAPDGDIDCPWCA